MSFAATHASGNGRWSISLVLTAGLFAQAPQDWLLAFPDDDLPQLLHRLERPSGRLAVLQALAKCGVRAHAPLLGMMRLPAANLPADMADGFGDLDARSVWMAPVLADMLSHGEAPDLVLDLLRRLGPVARAALPAVREFAARIDGDERRRRRVDLALQALAGDDVPAAPPSAQPALPPTATLLALVQDPASGRRWPALQALLQTGTDDDLFTALKSLLLQAAAGDATADRLRRTLNWTLAGRALPMDPGQAPASERLAAVRRAALVALPLQRAPQIGQLLGDGDAGVQQALLLWMAQRPRVDGYELSLLNMVFDALRRSDQLAPELRPLLRRRLSDGERQQLLDELRELVASERGSMQGSQHLLQGELDVVTPAMLPLLLQALSRRDSQVDAFAMRSLQNAGADCAPALLAAMDSSDLMLCQQLQSVLGRMRPTPPSVARVVLDALLDRNQRFNMASSTLADMQREVVVAELLSRLTAAAPPQLRWLARDLHDPRLDAALASIVQHSVEVDPHGFDSSACWQLFSDLAQCGDPGFERMVELLHHEDHDVRIAALRRFGSKMFDRPRQVDVLLQLLDDADAEIASHAAAGLGAVTTRKQEVAAILCRRFAAAAASLRTGIVTAFAGLGADAAAAVPLLEPLLQAAAADVRRGAAYALLRIQPEHADAVACMQALLRDADVDVRCQTMQSLRGDKQLQARFAASIVPQLDSDDVKLQQQVLFALHELPPEHAQKVAARVRALQLSTEQRLQFYARIVARDKLGDQ